MAKRGRTLALGAAALGAVVVLGLFLAPDRDEEAARAPAEGASDAPGGSSGRDDGPADPASPFAVATAPTAESGTKASDPPAARRALESSVAGPGDGRSDVAPLAGPIDVTTLGRENLDDEAFEALVARLRADPVLRQALVDEFRAENDPARLRLLTRLLGEFDDPAVTALAAELVYSGDEVSRAIGLDLLGRVQPGSAEARGIVSGLLATETDGRVLVPTLQALSRAGAVGKEERAALSSQLALLTTHEQASVRRLGVDILARWSDGQTHVPLFRDALADGDAGVRETAAYSLVGRGDPDGTTTRQLFEVVENEGEDERVRRGAMLALTQLPLDERGRARVEELQKALDRRPLR